MDVGGCTIQCGINGRLGFNWTGKTRVPVREFGIGCMRAIT